MENEFFLNAGIGPLIHLESSNQIMPNWKHLPHPMDQNCSSDRSPDCFYTNPSWEKSTDQQSMQFDSALSSMVSSPVASNSNISNDSFIIRELIGKLGNIGNNASEISIPAATAAAAAAAAAASAYQHQHHYSNSTNTSCYSTPVNSPPKIPLSSNSGVAEFAADPGFAERAARFSCFGSRSFNGRTSQFALNNGDYNNTNTNNNNNNNNIPGGSNSNPLAGNCKLSRVSSSPSLKALGVSQTSNSPFKDRTSQEESTVSEQNPNGEKALKHSNEMNSRKRKAASKGKAKETVLPSPSPSTKTVEPNDHSNSKRNKTTVEADGNEKGQTKAEEETKTSPKPPEPPKDYIHVRARRGQATDSHSLAERVRREKISERMKLLQDLVPGCNKVTGKALMLDEIINYVQSLQRQVEFLSMKLASVNTRLDANIDTLMSKDVFQPNSSMAHPIFPLDSSAQAVYGHHQHQQNQALHGNISCSNGPVGHCSTDPLDTPLLPPHLNGFSDIISQYPAFGEDDLQAIVQMGFGQIPNLETSLQPQSLHVPDQVSHMKVEL